MVQEIRKANADHIQDTFTENDARNAVVLMLGITNTETYIEPDCIIPGRVSIGKNTAVMTGNVINIDVEIGADAAVTERGSRRGCGNRFSIF